MIRIQTHGSYVADGAFCDNAELTPGEARENTIAYQILSAHGTPDDGGQMHIRFDSLLSEDSSYVGVIQSARNSGVKHYPLPVTFTNCHNSLCAVGGTINEDDHVFALSAAKKYGANYVPANLAVMHTYAAEKMAACGGMILATDSHARYGALGAMGFGEGAPELVKQLLGRTYDIPAPEVVLCRLSGKPKQGVGPQDIALAIIGATFKIGMAKNKILEFAGPGLKNLSVDYRCNIDTMMTETSCLSTIWETDDSIAAHYRVHGRPHDYKQMKAIAPAYYDAVVFIDLDKVESMIAVPFHPGNVFAIHEFQRNAKDIFAQVDADARKYFGEKTLPIGRKLQNGKVYADQGSIAGCVGGLYENVQEAAAILSTRGGIGNEGFSLTVYPASMPVNLALMRTGALQKLLTAGAVIKPCICGSCCGFGDIPADNSFSVRHTTRNFPSREGSNPQEGQSAFVALMDARSIAATAANKGAITAATDVAYTMPADEYQFDESPYINRVFYGFGKADPSAELVIGPNITDFPPIPELAPNILLELSAVIHDAVTTTDDLVPSGAATSYRSNPLRLAENTLSRRLPGYAGICHAIHKVEKSRAAGKKPEKLLALLQRVGNADELIGQTQFGSCLFARKPGEGSTREQAASCQKILGSIANISYEYATLRHRSNCINWGILPFTVTREIEFTHQPGEHIFVSGIHEAIAAGKTEMAGKVLKADGSEEKIMLHLDGLTQDERDILLSGSLMNYYRQQRK